MIEKDGRKAQQLWLACQTLVRTLDGDDDPDAASRKVALAADIRAVKEAGNEHVFVNTVINSIPERSLIEGVHTQAALLARFVKVKKMGRRVAMIDETGGSLMKYLLSYVQSLLVVDPVRALGPDDHLPADQLDTFALLACAERCLFADGDLEQAVRFVRQLRGQASVVAADWLREATLLLETRQAADALLGHASACGLGSLF